jgi:hypothetical protein
LRDLGGEKRVVGGERIDIMKKNNMFRILVAIVSMAAFALASRPACGQQGTLQTLREANEPLVEHLKVEDGNIFKRLPIPGTNWVNCGAAKLGNAVKLLRELYPNCTFAMDPRVAAVPLTDVIVRADDPATDLEALRTTSGGRFEFRYEQKGLFVLEYSKSTDVHPSLAEDRSIECFNLTGYLQREKATIVDEANKNKGQAGGTTAATSGPLFAQVVEGLQGIIQKSIADFDPSLGQPHFQFYPDAQMLIVIGPERAIDVAAKVIRALPGQQTSWGEPNDGGNHRRFQRDNQGLADPAAMRADALQSETTPPAPPVADDKSNNLNRP